MYGSNGQEGMNMFGECHAHLIMDGVNYRNAVALHRNGVVEAVIHGKMKIYRENQISFVRDGGDALGVSERAAQLAEEYGIDYRTPVFAIHKNGHYGGIVGYGFDTMTEYHALVKEVRARGGDFIKVMFSGIMDFAGDGGVNEEPLTRGEIGEMIHIAHEEGFAVMAHVNGARAVRNAAELGADSIEHGNFMDEDALYALAGSHAVWVPTLVTIANLRGSGRFDDAVIMRLMQKQTENIRKGFALGVKIALGSDAGAWNVMHGQGLLEEYRLIADALTGESKLPEEASEDFGNTGNAFGYPGKTGKISLPELEQRLNAAERQIRERFR